MVIVFLVGASGYGVDRRVTPTNNIDFPFAGTRGALCFVGSLLRHVHQKLRTNSVKCCVVALVGNAYISIKSLVTCREDLSSDLVWNLAGQSVSIRIAVLPTH